MQTLMSPPPPVIRWDCVGSYCPTCWILLPPLHPLPTWLWCLSEVFSSTALATMSVQQFSVFPALESQTYFR